MTWETAAVWMGMALLASLISLRIGVSVALVEICVGIAGGNVLGIQPTSWILSLAGFGSVVLTFLAGAEIDVEVMKHKWKETLGIGLASFLVPCLSVMAVAYWVAGWSLQASQVAGIALCATSVAVVYTVLVERGHNELELGKIILAACFVTDLGSVVALGLLFARYDWWMVLFLAVTALTLWQLPGITRWFFNRAGKRISEPELKFVLLILCALGALASAAQSEAVLPAYLVGLVLAPIFLANKGLAHRLRTIALTILTPFYFLKAGVLVSLKAVLVTTALIGLFFAVNTAAKLVSVWPLTRLFRFHPKEGMYTTLLMATGLTFGTISSLFGLEHNLITREQYATLVTVVILTAIIPTLVAERWFDPGGKPSEERWPDNRPPGRTPSGSSR
ncbi:MAG: cation:proton antiporter [Nitrospiraceae bacterium]|nr:cation:proton antiporter [Nitrospiraceae bacterium]